MCTPCYAIFPQGNNLKFLTTTQFTMFRLCIMQVYKLRNVDCNNTYLPLATIHIIILDKYVLNRHDIMVVHRAVE
jgi:hypothetical protein